MNIGTVLRFVQMQKYRGEPSKTPQVPKTPHARFSEVPDPTHFFNLPGKQKSFGENTVKVWWILLSLCLFYAVKCVFLPFPYANYPSKYLG